MIFESELTRQEVPELLKRLPEETEAPSLIETFLNLPLWIQIPAAGAGAFVAFTILTAVVSNFWIKSISHGGVTWR